MDEGVLIGGNHLATVLIGRLGGSFADKYPPTMPHAEALELMGAGDTYDVWCCWRAIMRARGASESNKSCTERQVGQAAPGVLTCGKWDYYDKDRAFFLDAPEPDDVMLKLSANWESDEERMAFAALVLKTLGNSPHKPVPSREEALQQLTDWEQENRPDEGHSRDCS